MTIFRKSRSSVRQQRKRQKAERAIPVPRATPATTTTPGDNSQQASSESASSEQENLASTPSPTENTKTTPDAPSASALKESVCSGTLTERNVVAPNDISQDQVPAVPIPLNESNPSAAPTESNVVPAAQGPGNESKPSVALSEPKAVASEPTEQDLFRRKKEAEINLKHSQLALNRLDRGTKQRNAILLQEKEDAAMQLQQAKKALMNAMEGNLHRANFQQWWTLQLEQYEALLSEAAAKLYGPWGIKATMARCLERVEEFDAHLDRTYDRVDRLTEQIDEVQGTLRSLQEESAQGLSNADNLATRDAEHQLAVLQMKLQFRERNVLTLNEKLTRNERELIHAKEAALQYDSQILFWKTNIGVAQDLLDELSKQIVDPAPFLKDFQEAEALVAQRKAEAEKCRSDREKLVALLQEARDTFDECFEDYEAFLETVDEE
jgi:hypothetical protein